MASYNDYVTVVKEFSYAESTVQLLRTRSMSGKHFVSCTDKACFFELLYSQRSVCCRWYRCFV